MKVFFTINIVIKYFLWIFLFLREINPIKTEKIINQKRKNEEIQRVIMKIGNYKKVKVINSEYIPNKVYINNKLEKIDINGYVEINEEDNEFNYITME